VSLRKTCGRESQDIIITDESIGGLRESMAARADSRRAVVDPDLVKELDARQVKYTGRLKQVVDEYPFLDRALGLLLFIWRILFSRIGPETGVMSFEEAGPRSMPRRRRRSPSSTWRGSMKRRTSSRRSWSSQEPFQIPAPRRKIPKGVLLVGPRDGKTLLPAPSQGKPMSPSSPSAARISWRCLSAWSGPRQDLFGQAQNNAPCIIFIDELDALAKRGGQSPGSPRRTGTDSQPAPAEMDGFDPNTA